MSVEALAVVLHHSRAKGTHKLVLLGIANHEGDGGAWPSVPTLARYANVSERHVQRSLAWLVGHGEVEVALQAGGGLGLADHSRPNRYRVLVTCPGWCDRSAQHRDTRSTAHPQRHLNLGITPPDLGTTTRVGGDARVTGGVTPVSPGGVTPVSPEPSLGTHPPMPPPPTDPRACRDCGQSEARCQASQSRWDPEDRHPYVALPGGHAKAHTPAAPARRRRG